MLSAALSAGNFVAATARRHTAANVAGGDSSTRLFRQIPDLVNGPSNTLVRIYVGAGIAEPWRWVPDAMFQAMALGDSLGLTAVALRSRICAEATFYSLKLQATGVPADKARSLALATGTGRVAAQRAWGFADADIVTTQVMAVTVPAAAKGPASAADAAVAGLNADGTAPARVFDGINGTAVAFNLELGFMIALYDLHAEGIIPRIMEIAIGMPACNGATLVITMAHHFVDPHKQICLAVVDQFVSETTVMLPGITKEEFVDVVCHKTSHVVQTTRLVGLARSAEVRVRLESIGHGGAVVRLPAKFDAERAAAAIQAVVRKGASASAKGNVAVDTDPVDEMYAAVTAIMEDDPSTQGTLAAKELVNVFKQVHGFGVAWLAGYLGAMYDDIGAKKRARSAVTARTLVGLLEDFEEAVAAGREHFGLVAKWNKARAKEGYLDGHGLFGAVPPAARGAPEVLDSADPQVGP